MATHSSILAWRIPWTEELGGLQSTGCKESDTTERLHFTFTYPCAIRISFLVKLLLLIYNIMLVSSVQQNDSGIYIHTSSESFPLVFTGY